MRFSFDHRGSDGFQRTAEQEVRWQQLLSDAEVVFGLPGESAQGLAELVRGHPGLRWVQATAGGVGEQVRGARLTGLERDRVLITRAAGVHAGPDVAGSPALRGFGRLVSWAICCRAPMPSSSRCR